MPISIGWIVTSNVARREQVNEEIGCDQEILLKTVDNTPQIIENRLSKNQLNCFQFQVNAGQTLVLDANTNISIVEPNNKVRIIQGKAKETLRSSGTYSLRIQARREDINYRIQFSLENQAIATQLSKANDREVHNFQNRIPINDSEQIQQLSYNVIASPQFNSNIKLQSIVDSIVNFAESRGLPIEKLSISLVDLSNSECCAYASYLDNETRYPASIVKLFWMVELYSQYQAGTIPEEVVLEKELYKMIQDSDNESASRILDRLSKTESGEALPKSKLDTWLARRYSVNQFFEQAGYQNINISQKPFPIPYLNFIRPEGRDLQIRRVNNNTDKPIRNYLTTYSTARLLSEIYTDRAVTSHYSAKMKTLLKRDLHSDAWKQKPYNSIAGFLGESLPVNTKFYSKMGWTFSNRNDATIVATPDGKNQYILVVFGDDPSFYKDKKFFPEISRLVYKRMNG
ncbi:serine hydrolase [Chroococcidiopsidales cyanobacterium LEGE 13417]|nr:serine hydrolase [Chroococcidiopsidales cyanobacterium LEGE 13417]